MQQILLATAISLGALFMMLYLGMRAQAGRQWRLFDNGTAASLVAVALAAMIMSGFIGVEIVALEHGWSMSLVAAGFVAVHVVACLLWPSAFRTLAAAPVKRGGR